jgi:Fe-S cluster assembly protein SufD
MSTATKAAGFTTDSVEAFMAARQEPAWLAALRRRAWQAYESLALPAHDTDDAWRRTDIRLLRLDRLAPAAGLQAPVPALSAAPAALLTQGVETAGRTVAVNGHTLVDEVDPALTKQGVLFGNLERLAAEHEQRVRPHLLTRAVDPVADKFMALHTALMTGGTLLYVPRGVVIDRPLHMLSGLAGGGVDFGHTLVVLEEGAEVTLLAETASGDEPGLHCGATEVFVGPGAKLRYVSLQNWGSGVWHFAHQKSLVERDAALQWTIGALGARLAKVDQHVSLVGSGAQAQVNGVMFTEHKQHLAYHTLQYHEAPNCRSDLLYKGALQDASRIVWRGMIKVAPGAQKTDGYQRDDNLMLSEEARADSIPGLEIEADDVRCTHGATAGRVDDEQIFYARSRGLTRKEATRMIVAGFFQQVFDRITIDSVREALGQAIGRRIREYS